MMDAKVGDKASAVPMLLSALPADCEHSNQLLYIIHKTATLLR